jgi:hypothetical protein
LKPTLEGERRAIKPRKRAMRCANWPWREDSLARFLSRVVRANSQARGENAGKGSQKAVDSAARGKSRPSLVSHDESPHEIRRKRAIASDFESRAGEAKL